MRDPVRGAGSALRLHILQLLDHPCFQIVGLVVGDDHGCASQPEAGTPPDGKKTVSEEKDGWTQPEWMAGGPSFGASVVE